MHTIRVLIADDHAIIREGLTLLLNSQPDLQVVGEAENGIETFRLSEDLHPDVVVMDVSMPGLGGAQTTRRLKEMQPDVRVLALSAHEDEVYVRQLLTVGAAGYVLKRTAADELVKAIRAVANGGTYLDPFVAGKVMSGYINRDSAEKDSSKLSRRETDVLQMMAHGHTNKEIAEQLCVSVKTVETYKSRFCEKLQLKSRADIVRYAISQGWIQGPATEDQSVN
jgi:DNA-binding NarL/FixJ family response regulator